MEIIICLLCAFIMIQSYLQHLERRDLYNRIMCKNLNEYKGEKTGYVSSAHEKVLKRWRTRDGED